MHFEVENKTSHKLIATVDGKEIDCSFGKTIVIDGKRVDLQFPELAKKEGSKDFDYHKLPFECILKAQKDWALLMIFGPSILSNESLNIFHY